MTQRAMFTRPWSGAPRGSDSRFGGSWQFSTTPLPLACDPGLLGAPEAAYAPTVTAGVAATAIHTPMTARSAATAESAIAATVTAGEADTTIPATVSAGGRGGAGPVNAVGESSEILASDSCRPLGLSWWQTMLRWDDACVCSAVTPQVRQ
jgi:hypothetical protein